VSSLILGLLLAGSVAVPALAATPTSAKAKKMSVPMSERAFTKPETIKGTLSLVQARQRLIVVTQPNGVPFDFHAAHAKIEANGSAAKLTTLTNDIGKAVSVQFLPYPSGDVAQRIALEG
jgi:ABC-type amino acid transport substrate-binding protein